MALALSSSTGLPPSLLPHLIGQVCFFAQGTAPAGFLVCNGAAVSRTTYAALFGAIGTTYGAGNGTTTFNLPEARGEFIRGLDSGRGVDTGRALGSAQGDQFQGHHHSLSNAMGNQFYQPSGGYGLPGETGDPVTDGINGTPRTGSETRPRNLALLVCVYTGV